MTFEQFLAQAEPFVDLFNAWAEFDWEIKKFGRSDHICFKCDDSRKFETMRAMLESESDFMYQSYIAGRRIAVFKIKQPIETVLGKIWYVELCDQKPDNSQKSGFHHIELHPAEGKSFDSLGGVIIVAGLRFGIIERPPQASDDLVLQNGFKVRPVKQPLIEKIREQEMRHCL